MSALTAPMPPSPLFAAAATTTERKDFAAELRKQTAACRVHHEKFGVRKALSPEQVAQAAVAFDADGKSLSAAKRLIDTKDPAVRAVSNVRSRAGSYWKACTTPYPEPGVRLIRRGSIDAFNTKMTEFRTELIAAAKGLQERYAELRERAREKLGDLFDPGDYPPRIDVLFALEWDIVSIDPPAYLKELHPALYEQEQQKIRGRFEEALRLTEEAMASQLAELVNRLVEQLNGTVDGKPKVIRSTSVANLVEFFDAFKAIDLGSNAELQALVRRAQDAVKGVGVGDLRDNEQTRASVGTALAGVRDTLDALMVNRPKRAISLEDES